MNVRQAMALAARAPASSGFRSAKRTGSAKLPRLLTSKDMQVLIRHCAAVLSLLVSALATTSCTHATATTDSGSTNSPTLLGFWKERGTTPKFNHDLNQHWVNMRFLSDETVRVKYP